MQGPDAEFIQSRLHWRQSIKQFDPARKIPDPDWHVLEESLRLAPSSYGLQPWTFALAQSPEVRRALSENNGNHRQFETCSHLLVIARLKTMDLAYVEKNLLARGTPTDRLPKDLEFFDKAVINGPHLADMPHWTAKQAYIAMGFFLSTAAMLGIDACPIEGIDRDRFDEILRWKGGPYGSIVAVAAGYRPEDSAVNLVEKQRFKRGDVFKEL